MSERQAYVLLKVIHRMVLMMIGHRVVSTTDLQEWSREIAYHYLVEDTKDG